MRALFWQGADVPEVARAAHVGVHELPPAAAVALDTALHGVFNSDQAPCFRFPVGAGAHECGAQHAVADRPLQHAL